VCDVFDGIFDFSQSAVRLMMRVTATTSIVVAGHAAPGFRKALSTTHPTPAK
jgi:hypothetical protein